MEANAHSLQNLFEQLGLPNSREEIDAFVKAHRLPAGVRIIDAPFWTKTQSTFLTEAIVQDADWAAIVDELAVLLS